MTYSFYEIESLADIRENGTPSFLSSFMINGEEITLFRSFNYLNIPEIFIQIGDVFFSVGSLALNYSLDKRYCSAVQSSGVIILGVLNED